MLNKASVNSSSLKQATVFKRAFILICFILGTAGIASSQEKDSVVKKSASAEFNIRNTSFLLPQAQKKWKFTQAISLYFIVPPKDWILDGINTPFLTYSCKLALPKAFNFQVNLSTIFVSNRINFGPYWNFVFKKFHFSVGYQAAYNLGYLGDYGFNTLFNVWEQQPSLTAAYNFGKTAFIVRGDLYYTSSVNITEAGFKIRSKEHFVNGYSVTSTFDQRLHKNKIMSVGIKISYLRYHIIAWPALPVNHYRYPVPEFQIGYNF